MLEFPNSVKQKKIDRELVDILTVREAHGFESLPRTAFTLRLSFGINIDIR